MRHRSCGDHRIAIIGAGPAGLSAAYFLKKQGYRDVLVLEKLGRVGGMCRTITEDYLSFDLGANYLTPAYWETFRLAFRYRMKTYGERSPMALNLPDLATLPADKKKYEIRSIWAAAREKSSFWELIRTALKYTWLRFKLRRIIDRPGFRGIAEHPELCVDFETWLDQNNLSPLKRLFEIPITIMGYGYLHKIAAPYALKYMSLLTFVPMMFKVFPLFSWIPWPRRFVHGYQRLWEAVAKDLNVRLNICIKKIKRDNGKVVIDFTYEQQVLDKIKTRDDQFTFDHLIVACPLDGIKLKDLLDQDEREEEAFRATQTYSYCLTSFNVQFSEIPWEQQLFATVPLTEIRTPWAITRQMKDSTLMQFYTRLELGDDDKVMEPKVTQEIKDLVDRLGGTIDHEEWSTYDRWPYFQHVTAENMKEGFYDKLENLQGYRNTYYSGGLMNFELVEQIIAYNRHLIGKYFSKTSTDGPG